MKPRTICHEDVRGLRQVGCTYAQIAEIMQISRPAIYQILKKAAIQSPWEIKRKTADQVIDMIMKDGGRLAQVINANGFDVSPNTVYRRAKERGVRVSDYFYYRLQNKNWIVDQPLPSIKFKGGALIWARCKHCGHEDLIKAQSIYLPNGKTCQVCGSESIDLGKGFRRMSG